MNFFFNNFEFEPMIFCYIFLKVNGAYIRVCLKFEWVGGGVGVNFYSLYALGYI